MSVTLSSHSSETSETSEIRETSETLGFEAQVSPPPSVAVILGSAFSRTPPRDLRLTPRLIPTPWGEVVIHEVDELSDERPAYVVFRHGLPHQAYPQDVNFRAYAVALKLLNCQALLVTSSVGVLDPVTPLDHPLQMEELLMPDNRLPNGELCTVLTERMTWERQAVSSTARSSSTTAPALDIQSRARLDEVLSPGHLVLRGPLCSPELDRQVSDMIQRQGHPLSPPVTFAYVAGPRTKTTAENRYWARLGAQVNSMSVGPELILASELEIPVTTLFIGHKRSRGSTSSDDQITPTSPQLERSTNESQREMSATLQRSHQILEELVTMFLKAARPVVTTHYIYRYSV